MIRTSLLSSTLVLAASLSGQSVYVPDNDATTGVCNVIPLGSTATTSSFANQKYQCMITTADMAGAQVLDICDLGFAPCATGMRHFDSIEIVMAQTSAATLSTTFATNLSTNVMTVLAAKDYTWHQDSADVWTRIGLDTNYNYIRALGDNIVVQITVTGAVLQNGSASAGMHRGTRQRVYATNYTGQTTGTSSNSAAKIELYVGEADLQDFGVGCKGTAGVPDLHLSGDPTIGTGSVAVEVSNCVANATVLHVFGLTRFEPAFVLGPAAPGCKVFQSTDIIIGGVASGAGMYGVKFPIPLDRSLICLRIYTQVFPSDSAANNWGRTASNYGRILPGL